MKRRKDGNGNSVRMQIDKSLEMKRIKLVFRQWSQPHSILFMMRQPNSRRIQDQLAPFVIGEDTAKYLVKFEHVYERDDIQRSPWAQNLLALLPEEASDVATCLSNETCESYDEAKDIF